MLFEHYGLSTMELVNWLIEIQYWFVSWTKRWHKHFWKIIDHCGVIFWNIEYNEYECLRKRFITIPSNMKDMFWIQPSTIYIYVNVLHRPQRTVLKYALLWQRNRYKQDGFVRSRGHNCLFSQLMSNFTFLWNIKVSLYSVDTCYE